MKLKVMAGYLLLYLLMFLAMRILLDQADALFAASASALLLLWIIITRPDDSPLG